MRLRKGEHGLRKMAERTKSLSDYFRRRLSTYTDIGLIRCFRFTRQLHSPSMTTLMLSKRLCTTAKVCAAVIRASSCVSRSNLLSMLSISLSPNNFFANCSVTRSEIIGYDFSKRLLTESSSTDLLPREGKDRNQLDHYLCDYILH